MKFGCIKDFDPNDLDEFFKWILLGIFEKKKFLLSLKKRKEIIWKQQNIRIKIPSKTKSQNKFFTTDQTSGESRSQPSLFYYGL